MPIEMKKSSGIVVGTADQDYFLDANRELTTDEEKAAFLLIREGQNVPKEMADKYGIGKVAQPDEKAESKPVKKAAKSSENKAEKPAEDK